MYFEKELAEQAKQQQSQGQNNIPNIGKPIDAVNPSA